MSEILEAALAALETKLDSGFDGTAKFVIEDEGSIILDRDGVRTSDDNAEVTLIADADTFRAILDGALNPMSAFMTGRLRIEGDMGAAMRLGSVLA